MDAISRIVGSMANVAVTRTNREQADELRSSLGRGVASSDSRTHEAAVNGANAKSGASGVGVNADNDVNEMFSYMNNTMEGGNSVLWGSGVLAAGAQSDEPAQAAAVFSAARDDIQQRSEVLANELNYASARGLDVTPTLEAMTNLSENLNVLDANAAVAGAVNFAPDFGGEAPVSFSEIADEMAVEVVTVPPSEGDDQPAFAVSGPFEGNVSEQIAQVTAEQDPEDMSIAAQIAADAKSEHAESIDIMNDAPDNTNIPTGAVR
ncbi:MAG: hypothetical protein FWD35_00785 [Oscillospiraceae bacterium]|nr:hypothetical protein [Oscillospiraceae bacterium]